MQCNMLLSFNYFVKYDIVYSLDFYLQKQTEQSRPSLLLKEFKIVAPLDSCKMSTWYIFN
jgi:hypothetical protein